MKISEIINLLESVAPPRYQEHYDNSGLIAGDIQKECTGILISLDCTEALIREAIEKSCNLVISHHPLIFRPIRRITPETGNGRTLIEAIRHGISIYAIHTNLDNIFAGVNATIADKLGLENRRILLPKPGETSVGSGLIGDLKTAVPEQIFLAELKKKFGIPLIRHSPLNGNPVSKVAVCGGAGSFLISNALREGADFFITGDIKYHDFFEGEGKLVIADIGHFESEQFTTSLLHDIILKKFPNFAVLKSGTITNPVNYYI
jgi:dinuclear metal center YbgI/SA1388 family protein